MGNTDYEYVRDRFCPSGANTRLKETIEIPHEAVGVSLSTWGDPTSQHDNEAWVTASYLLPVGHPKLGGDDE